MSRDEIRAFCDRWNQAFTSLDADGLAAMHAPDCKVTSPMFGHMTGREAVAESYARLFTAFPGWEITTTELLIDGDRVAQVFASIGTHKGEFMGIPGTGKKAQLHGVRLMRLKDGLIQEETRLYDFTLLLMQVGVLRGKPGH
jgi:steroid delta-isomerase-like uncharacterized protein